ncbi:hypothetical protein IEO21_03679 [Rhodonia placenta]|uniref:Uncharacterized protein n=1 Tax=Rhodonia placenta TaxID=104341 RepID=A0A8H7P5H8_9APHY|nr:hypothetical protein IEO21_03679 [Postia placenta]
MTALRKKIGCIFPDTWQAGINHYPVNQTVEKTDKINTRTTSRTASQECATEDGSGLQVIPEAGQNEQNIPAVTVLALHITPGHLANAPDLAMNNVPAPSDQSAMFGITAATMAHPEPSQHNPLACPGILVHSRIVATATNDLEGKALCGARRMMDAAVLSAADVPCIDEIHELWIPPYVNAPPTSMEAGVSDVSSTPRKH